MLSEAIASELPRSAVPASAVISQMFCPCQIVIAVTASVDNNEVMWDVRIIIQIRVRVRRSSPC